jgi:hypothetical protein
MKARLEIPDSVPMIAATAVVRSSPFPFIAGVLAALVFPGAAHAAGLTPIASPIVYSDGRPSPSYRMAAVDLGEVLHYGSASGGTDALGAREALINQVDGKFYLFYDGAGPVGWLAHLAESTDLVNWDLKGPILSLGAAGSSDSASASSPWIIKDDNNVWQMFYLGTPNASPAPDRIPAFPYLTLRATAPSPAGPWTKHYTPAPISTSPGTYYSATASPGAVLKNNGQYLMFFSSTNASTKRTLSIARAQSPDTAWTVDPSPALPVTEQIENSSLYYEPTNQTWFLFTNHIGLVGGSEYTDSIWVYWSKDLNTWDPAHKAVVLDGSNCTWSSACIGMPSVTVVGDKLNVFYDAPGGTSTSHMGRSIGRATLQLPLTTTVAVDSTPPSIASLYPLNATAGVVPETNAVVRFDEAVRLGTGNVLIRKLADDSVVETISTTSGRIAIAGALVTIDPAGTLDPNTSYYLEIATGVIVDLSGNPFAGIAGRTAWSFTTGVSNPVPVTVVESSFEGAKSVGGWTGGAGAQVGQSTASIPAPWVAANVGSGSGWIGAGQYNDPMPDGDIYLYFNGPASMAQTLTEKVKPFTTYTLKVAVGRRKDLGAQNPAWAAFAGYKIELLSGSTVVGSSADTSHGGYGATPASGAWEDAVVIYTSTDSPPLSPLGIRITGFGTQTNYDNVRLTADVWTPPNDFSTYISNPAFGLSAAQQGFAQDPDGDGIPNGLEWILKGNSATADAGSLISIFGSATDGIKLTFGLDLSALASGATLAVEYSMDLNGTWTAAPVTAAGGAYADGVTVTVNSALNPPLATVTIPARATTGGKLFSRLRATVP